MNEIKMFPIGKIVNEDGNARVELYGKFACGLKGLENFSHVQILWWMDGCDNETDRSTLVERKPYRKGPDELGVYALRSPERPNPIAVSNVDIAYVDAEHGIIGLYYIDAFDGSVVLDIKPYTPSIDRIENTKVPSWCNHWPKSYEESADFDWDAEFNF